MILYFSGTGNSEYIAKIINNVINDEIISINQCLKNNKKYCFDSKKPYVIVAPTYAWQMPRVVETFIRTSDLNGNKKIYFVLTCGSNIGNASKYAGKLARDKKMEYMGIKEIIMPENFITMFKAPSKDDAKQIIKHAQKETLAIAQMIEDGIVFDKFKYQFGSITQSSLINTVFYPLFVKDEGFYSTDKCIGCGKCKQLCPLNNIEIIDHKPKWNHRCTQCMACIGGCPYGAIEYKNKTQTKKRYYFERYFQE